PIDLMSSPRSFSTEGTAFLGSGILRLWCFKGSDCTDIGGQKVLNLKLPRGGDGALALTAVRWNCEVRMLNTKYLSLAFLLLTPQAFSVDDSNVKERFVMVEIPAAAEVHKGDAVCLQRFGKDFACGVTKFRYTKSAVVKFKFTEDVTE